MVAGQISHNLKILVADDDPAVLDVFRQVLSSSEFNPNGHLKAEAFKPNDAIQFPPLSFDLVTCKQGLEAVNAVKRSVEENRPFSVAFIDIRMPPGPDGIWTAEQIRRLDENVEILIMTGYSDVHPLDISRRVPPHHKLLYVQKPFHVQEIYQFASALSMKWHTECEFYKLNKFLEQCVEDRIQEIIILNKELQKKLAELQKAQSALQESEGKLNAMILSISDHVSMMDKDLNIIWANKTAMEIFGDNIIGKKCYEAYHRRKEPCEPYPCLTLKAFEDGQVHEHETQVIDKNGNMRFFYCTANVALRNENGNPTAVLEVSRDITEQKLALKALQESETRYRALTENNRVGIWQITLDGSPIYVNPEMCRMLEIEGPEELYGKSFHSFFDAKNLEIVKREIAKREKGLSSTYEVEITGKKGTKRNVMISGAPIFSSEDKIHSAIGTFIDITEKKRAELALKEAKKDLDRRVKERTAELDVALKKIKVSEKELMERKTALELLNAELLKTNQAVSVLAKNIDRKKEELERKVYEICSGKLMPILKNLQKDVHCKKREADLELILNYLNKIVHETPPVHYISSRLTEQEMRVALLVKNGMTNQQIADSLCISAFTVKTHRRNIRKKLNIENKNINLFSYLKSRLESGLTNGS